MFEFVGLFFNLLYDILSQASNVLFKYIIFILLAGLVFESFYGLMYFRD